MPDDLASTLAGIKERADAAAELNVDLFAKFVGPDTMTIGGWIAASAMDVPSLVAAIDKVLELTEPSGEVDRDWDGNEEKEPAVRMVRCDTIREAITRELAGTAEEGSDG